MEHFLHQSLEKIGLSHSLTEEFQKKIIQRLKGRANLNWLTKNTIESEIKFYYRDNSIPLYWGVPKVLLDRVNCKIGTFVTKQCAKKHEISITNIRPDDQNLFIVHDYMCPFIFFNDHLANINNSKNKNVLWSEPRLKEWKKTISQQKDLISNMVDTFETLFHAEIESGSINRIAKKKLPVNSVLFRLETNKCVEKSHK